MLRFLGFFFFVWSFFFFEVRDRYIFLLFMVWFVVVSIFSELSGFR